MAAVAKRRRGKLAFAVAGSVFLLYNANGREIGSIDSQPAKYTALELALHRTFILDNVIGYAPGLQGRAAFARCLDGHYRSAYSVAPSVIAGGVALALRAIHVVDLRAPLAASLVAKITASALTALAVLLAFLAAERRVSPGTAALIALGFGLGTNLWAV